MAELEGVSQDPVYWVRKEACFALGALAKVVPDEVVQLSLVNTFSSAFTHRRLMCRAATTIQQFFVRYARSSAILWPLCLASNPLEATSVAKEATRVANSGPNEQR